MVREGQNLLGDRPTLDEKSVYCFLPYPQQSGSAEAVLLARLYDTDTNSYLGDRLEITLRANIIERNDRPVILKSTFTLPRPLPYNFSEITGLGTRVSEILTSKSSSDSDGDTIGKLFDSH